MRGEKKYLLWIWSYCCSRFLCRRLTAAPKWRLRLWPRLLGKIIICLLEPITQVEATIADDWTSKFKAGLGCWKAEHKPVQLNVDLAWAFLSNALFSLLAVVGLTLAPKQTHYQRINSSLDLHFGIHACQHSSARLHLLCLTTIPPFCQHRATAIAVKCPALLLDSAPPTVVKIEVSRETAYGGAAVAVVPAPPFLLKRSQNL